MILVSVSNTIIKGEKGLTPLRGMRTQHIVIFFAVFAIFVSAIVWRVDGLMFGDRLNWSEAQARSQMSAIVQSLETETRSLSTLLSLGYTEVEIGKRDYSADRAYGKFEMMAKLLPPNPKTAGDTDWQIASKFYKDKSQVRSWTDSYLPMVLRNIRDGDIKPGASNVYALLDPSRKSYLLVVYHGDGNWYAGLIDSAAFQSTVDRQKGQMSSVFLVNQQGQALGHTVREYVGSLLSEDPIVSDLMRSAVGSGSGIFKNLKGQSVQGFYEQVGFSNLFVVITTPVAMLTESRSVIIFQLLIMGLGLGMLGLAAFVYYYNPEAGQKAVRAFATVIKEQARPAVAKAVAEVKAALPSLKREPAPVAEEISAKVPIAETKKTVEKPAGYKSKLEAALMDALTHIQDKLKAENIELVTDLEPVTGFSVSAELMTRALENIFFNAIESMEYAPRKKLSVKLSEKAGKIFLAITDTGVGIDSSVHEKIFEPFYTTKTGSHVGMGLSLASGIIKGSYGEISLTSAVGRGTQIMLTFSPPEEPLSQFPGITPYAQITSDLLLDSNIERLIDGLDEDSFDSKSSVSKDDEFFHQNLAFEQSALSGPKQFKKVAVIDKPSIEFKRKVSKLDELEVSIRRPGEYL